MDLNSKLEQISREFCIEGDYLGYEPICIGNVNKTYEVRFRQPDGSAKSYLLQNVNTYAFRRPVELMENIDRVTEHIRRKNPDRTVLHFHHTRDRKIYVAEGENFWRMSNFIRSVTFSDAMDPEIVRSAGVAFGDFQMQLSDFDSSLLFETIPGFHDTRQRYQQLRSAIRLDPAGRGAGVAREISFLLQAENTACTLTDMQHRGQLPVRVTHNDTKINNVLFCPEDRSAMVVIDLDTVMPGLVGHDFGDAIRFAANTAEEDCPDPGRAGINLDIFQAFSRGFLEKMGGSLTAAEIATLPISCFCLAAELAVRFLTDYLLGDPYFNIKSPDHNLIRTRCQIALAKDILLHLHEMEKIIDSELK